MSGAATGWVLRHGPQDRALRLVLLTIADAANADGKHAHPGIDGICRGSLYSRRQVQRALEQLLTEGWIAVEEEGGGRGRATVYCLPAMDPDTPSNGATMAPFTDRKQCHPERETVSSGTLNGAISARNSAMTPPMTCDDAAPTVSTTVTTNVETQRPALFDAPAAASPARKRAADPIWDALVVALGHGPGTKSERGAWNAAAKQLRDVGATAAQVSDRATAFRRQWPDATLTPNALVRHWGFLAQDTQAPRSAGPPRSAAAQTHSAFQGLLDRSRAATPLPTGTEP